MTSPITVLTGKVSPLRFSDSADGQLFLDKS